MVDDTVVPPMHSDPLRMWLVCELCVEEVSYERAYGVGEAPAAFIGMVKAGLADAYNLHLIETHD